MNVFKAATLSAAMLAATAIAASAQETASAPPTNPSQVYSASRTPGPSVGHSNWIPPSPSSAGAAPGTPVPSNHSPIYESASSGAQTSEGHFYSKKGFGPAPN